jgi:4-diphosphocytidyl-2-C-methyl-D-erythritol kinase
MLTVSVPAKVNLFLRVVRRREDGYHELETVMQSVSLTDELSFAPAPELRLACNWPELPIGPDNLVWRAAEALRLRLQLPPGQGADITIQKQIPASAGLGGGSADAAAALIGCARLWNVSLPAGEMAAIAAELGSDAPFFLEGGAAVARGRGERLEPFHPAPSIWLVLVKPPFSVSTPWAYRSWRPDVRSGASLEEFLDALRGGAPEAVAAALRNDLEPGVAATHPEISALRERLLSLGALGTRMTGSGSAVFGVAARREDATRIAREFGTGLGEVFVVETLTEGAPRVEEG